MAKAVRVIKVALWQKQCFTVNLRKAGLWVTETSFQIQKVCRHFVFILSPLPMESHLEAMAGQAASGQGDGQLGHSPQAFLLVLPGWGRGFLGYPQRPLPQGGACALGAHTRRPVEGEQGDLSRSSESQLTDDGFSTDEFWVFFLKWLKCSLLNEIFNTLIIPLSQLLACSYEIQLHDSSKICIFLNLLAGSKFV